MYKYGIGELTVCDPSGIFTPQPSGSSPLPCTVYRNSEPRPSTLWALSHLFLSRIARRGKVRCGMFLSDSSREVFCHRRDHPSTLGVCFRRLQTCLPSTIGPLSKIRYLGWASKNWTFTYTYSYGTCTVKLNLLYHRPPRRRSTFFLPGTPSRSTHFLAKALLGLAVLTRVG